MSSQASLAQLLGNVKGGVSILEKSPSYNPDKDEIKIPALKAIITNAEAADTSVISTGKILDDLRLGRRLISYNSKTAEENCLENLIVNVTNYVKYKYGEKSAEYKNIMAIIKKMKPSHKKKDKPAEGETDKSRSTVEKTFQAMVEYGNQLHEIILSLGTTYTPDNAAIMPDAFKAKVDQLDKFNQDIAVALDNCSKAVTARRELYSGEGGIKAIINTIKNYLASLTGGKKNPLYVSFTNAIK